MMFAFVVFLSAFLLFQVQLIVAKHLLPWFRAERPSGQRARCSFNCCFWADTATRTC